MKNKLTAALLLLAAAFSIVSCGNDENGNDVTAGYYVSNGSCYNGSNNQVDNNYCSGMYDYYAVNGYCYSPEGIRVEERFCQNNSRYLQPQVRECVGQFYSPTQRRNFTRGGGGHQVGSPQQNRGGNSPQPGNSRGGPQNHGSFAGTSCEGNSCQGKVMYSPQGQLIRCR